MHSTRSTTKLLLAVLGASSVVQAHSWVEQLTVIAPNGTFVGEPGYPRGNVRRTDPGFSDVPMVHLITEGPTDPMCKDTQKSPSSQSSSSPRLKATAGADIALRFQENGHVTLPQAQAGKPENRGDIFVYGTTKPKDNELFHDVHGVWTADGKGGDGRGILLAKAVYDDGQCYQVNGGAISTDRQAKFKHQSNQLMGADLWCQTDVRLPADAPNGQPYTLYWVWTWPTAAGIDPGLPKGKNETYTTCMDVDVTGAGNFSQKVVSGGFIQGQPIESAAVPDQFAKLGEQPASNPAAQSAPASAPTGFAPVAVVPIAAEPAPAPAAPPPSAPSVVPAPVSSAASSSSSATHTCSSAAPARSNSAGDAPAPVSSSVPLLAPPFPIQTASANRTLTTLRPIPAPSAPSASNGSVTALSPIPAPSASAASGEVQSIAAPATVTVTATPDMAELMSIMATMTMQPNAATSSQATPKIRGRNRLFQLGN